MKIGLIILCRYSSSRLPGKVLKEINGKPLLQHILDRLKKTAIETIVVATSDEDSDQPIVDFCMKNNIDYFRGNLHDVSGRFAACCDRYRLDYGIRINGDNLFIDPYTIDKMLKIAESGEYNLVTNVPGRTFPHGMSVEIVNAHFYQQQRIHFKEDKYKEHVTLYFYENQTEKLHTFINTEYPIKQKINLAVDTIEDFELVSKMMKEVKFETNALRLKDIIELYEKISNE